MGFRTFVGVEDHLNDAVTVTQVNKNEAAEIAIRIDPATNRNVLANIVFSQFATSISTEHDSRPLPSNSERGPASTPVDTVCCRPFGSNCSREPPRAAEAKRAEYRSPIFRGSRRPGIFGLERRQFVRRCGIERFAMASRGRKGSLFKPAV